MGGILCVYILLASLEKKQVLVREKQIKENGKLAPYRYNWSQIDTLYSPEVMLTVGHSVSQSKPRSQGNRPGTSYREDEL